MRVNDLSKEIGRSNREVLSFLEEKGEKKAPMSNVTAEEADMIRNHFKPKNTEAVRVDKSKTQQDTAERAEMQGEQPKKKKKFTAVFRPENAQQIRVKGAAPEGAKAAEKPAQEKPADKPKDSTEKKAESVVPQQKKSEDSRPPVKTAVSSRLPQGRSAEETRLAIQSRLNALGNIGPRNGGQQRQGGGYGNRNGQGNGGYGNRNGQGNGGYGNRNGQGGGYGNRNGQSGGGYGNRNGQGSGSYGNRNGQGAGARPGQGGFSARPGQGGGSYGNRGGAQGASASGDSALVKKTVSSRPNKNNFKDKNDKRHKTEDGFKSGSRTGKATRHPFIMPEKPKAEKVEEEIKELILPDTLTIGELAKMMKRPASDLIKKLFAKGEMYTMNSEIAYEKAEEIALEYEILCTREEKVDVIEELLREDNEDPNKMVARPPVVVVMGHVDHGKTSLLDAIRKTSVTSREAGGITQHIGAYQVKAHDRLITFLDTPGHEAFTAMRMRGAEATDIAVLVVAADDGVMPQTVEAISHAKAANVEIIVAVNKMDKPDANIERVKQELMKYELVAEDWGGDTIICPISAKTHEGIDNLLDMILLTADVKELKANPNRNARGLVIEAQLDKGKGPVATILVQKGTLHVGDYVAAGACSGKVRAMLNDRGMRVKEAKPSTPVEIQGLNAVPNAGEIMVAMDTDKEAKDFAATFISEGKNKLIEETKAKLSLDDVFGQIKAGEMKELPIIVKADVQGSVEAVKQSLSKLSNDEVQVKVIHSGVGAISESDVALASASNAIIIGFNVRADATAKSTAEHEQVDLRLYKVIYQAIDDVERALNGMLAPVYEEKVIGHAEVRAIFKASGIGTIAGSYVLDGKIQRGCKARITRGKDLIFEGDLASLKRFKDDVKEVATGYECGLVFEKFNDLQEGDQVEAYAMVEVPRDKA